MVVICGKIVVGQILSRITRSPLVIHHLDVQVAAGVDVQGLFNGPNALTQSVSRGELVKMYEVTAKVDSQ